MNLHQQINTSPQNNVAPILLLLSGLVFCVVVKSINGYFLSIDDAVKANYLVSKPSCGANYLWFCELIFSGFIALGLLSLIRGKGKICSAILIMSYLDFAINLAVIKTTVKNGHMRRIAALEVALTEAKTEPYPSGVISLYRARHKGLVDIWNELHNNKYVPIAELTPTETTYTKLIRHQLLDPPNGIPDAERIVLTQELLHPWKNISGQCSFIVDAIHQLSETTHNPPETISHLCTPSGRDFDGFSFGLSSGCLAIGTNGWFRFVTHSSHHDYTVGDLSIGRDHKENYYFSCTHVCGAHRFLVGPGKKYTSMEDFLARNQSWYPIENIDEWKESNKFTGQLFKEYGTFHW